MRYSLLGIVAFCLLISTPVQAQFEDWTNLESWGRIEPPQPYQHPSYADPYAPMPTPQYEDPWADHQRSLEQHTEGLGMSREAFEANRALDTMLYRGRCLGLGVAPPECR